MLGAAARVRDEVVSSLVFSKASPSRLLPPAENAWRGFSILHTEDFQTRASAPTLRTLAWGSAENLVRVSLTTSSSKNEDLCCFVVNVPFKCFICTQNGH